MKKPNILLIGGCHNSYESFVSLCKILDGYSKFIYTCSKAATQLALTDSYYTYVKGPLGLKDIGLIIEESNNNDVIIINHDIGNDFDSIKAVEIITSEVSIPVISLSSTDNIFEKLNELPT